MKHTITLVLCLAFFSTYSQNIKKDTPTIHFIPTIHSLHNLNARYNYDSLKKIVAALKPDIIAVEIRPEDINQDSSYLKRNYPYEMRMMQYWFPKAAILGFDWLGEDIEGKMIPANYWKEISPIKKFERALDADSVYSAKCQACDSFSTRRMEILKNYSLKEILVSEDAALTKAFYSCLETNLAGSTHKRVLRFYDLRNARILENINRIISENKGKTIVILTGDDHYVLLKFKLRV